MLHYYQDMNITVEAIQYSGEYSGEALSFLKKKEPKAQTNEMYLMMKKNIDCMYKAVSLNEVADEEIKC